MEPFTAAFESAILANCEANAKAIAAVLSRALGCDLTVSVDGLVDATGPAPAAWQGPGLVMPMRIAAAEVGDVVAILPAAGGLLPEAVTRPEAAGSSRRETLARELAPLVLASQAGLTALASVWAANLSAACQFSPGAKSRHRLSLALRSGESEGSLEIVWPVAATPHAGSAAAGPSMTASAPKTAPPAPSAAPAPSASAPPNFPPFHAAPGARDSGQGAGEMTLESLPSFSRNLLRIKMPMMVTLASKRQAVGKIVELLPGSIIQFNKSCEEMLEMEVNGHPIALGECVKVGDKFGLRVTSIQLPGERFATVMGSRRLR